LAQKLVEVKIGVFQWADKLLPIIQSHVGIAGGSYLIPCKYNNLGKNIPLLSGSP
jgi:hypothetical protein